MNNKQLALQYKQYRENGGTMKWNDYQKQSFPSNLDTDYIKLLEYVKSRSLRDRRSLSSLYDKIKNLLELYSAESASTYEKYALSDYEDESYGSHYKMLKLRLDKLRTMLDCVFQAYNDYVAAQEDKHSRVDRSSMFYVGKYSNLDEDDE